MAIVVLIGTLVLAGIAALVGGQYLWGVNHLQFLPVWCWGLLALALFACLLGLIFPDSFDRQFDTVGILLFQRGAWPVVGLAIGCGVIFFVLRGKSLLLGDGYTILANFGQGETYYSRSTEILSVELIRRLQAAMGGYDRDTAMRAIQLLSCLSGAVTVYFFVVIAKLLGRDAVGRILIFVTLFGSTALMLFFGYIEFYPMLWAAGTWYLASALKTLATGCGRWQVVLALLVAAAMHLEALVLFPGTVLVLLAAKPNWLSWKRIGIGIAIAVVIGAAVYVWLYRTRLDFAIVFLPPFTGRPRSPEYAIWSARHILDIANLVIYVFPGALALLWLWLRSRPLIAHDVTSKFLLLITLPALALLMLVDPVLGMARDWDLFSFTLLPAVLLVLHQIVERRPPSRGFVMGYTAVCMILAGLAIAPNVWGNDPARRLGALLDFYGRKDHSGWVVLNNYLRDARRIEQAQATLMRWESVFPEDKEFRKASDAVMKGDAGSALAIGLKLLVIDPYRWDFHHLVGVAYARVGNNQESESHYKTALQLSPNMPTLRNDLAQLYLNTNRLVEAEREFLIIRRADKRLTYVLEGLGLVYVKMDRLDAAMAIADTLFQGDSNSPGGHLLFMTIALRRSDQAGASLHSAAIRDLRQGEIGLSRESWTTIAIC